MPIDPHQAVGLEFQGGRTHWDRKDIILYNMSLGAGWPPDEERELTYTGIRSLQALPTFGVVPTSAITSMLHTLPGLDFDPAMKVHGEQRLKIHAPIPESAEVVNRVRVAEVQDKSSGAAIVLEIKTETVGGTLLFTNQRTTFVRGEGGFGGPKGQRRSQTPPERNPDHLLEVSTLPQQALLYNLASGDDNPLHTDPVVAQSAGFPGPILHGLCTFGMVCKAVVDQALGGKASVVSGMEARFSAPVFPGETLAIAMWRETSGIYVQAQVKERGVIVLTDGLVTLHG